MRKNWVNLMLVLGTLYSKKGMDVMSCHSFHNSLVCVKQAKREASLLCLSRAQWDFCNVDENFSVFKTAERAK